MTEIIFFIPGKPQGKARARTFYSPSLGKHISMTPDQTVLYENLIKASYINTAKGVHFDSGIPVELDIVAHFEPTKSTSKKKRALMLEGKELPLKKPDMDNIVKVIADALNSVAYHDDTQVYKLSARKEYSEKEGVTVTLRALD